MDKEEAATRRRPWLTLLVSVLSCVWISVPLKRLGCLLVLRGLGAPLVLEAVGGILNGVFFSRCSLAQHSTSCLFTALAPRAAMTHDISI